MHGVAFWRTDASTEIGREIPHITCRVLRVGVVMTHRLRPYVLLALVSVGVAACATMGWRFVG